MQIEVTLGTEAQRVVRLMLRLFGRDVIELTTDPAEEDDPTAAVQGFGFAAGSSLFTERAEYDDEPVEERA